MKSNHMQGKRGKFEYTNNSGNPMHTWSVIGELAAIHLHITDRGEPFEIEFGYRYSGGLEMHYRTAPDYMRGHAPSQDDCWLLHCPCWHDGSSLAATETWIPMWLASTPTDYDFMLSMLAKELEERSGVA